MTYTNFLDWSAYSLTCDSTCNIQYQDLLYGLENGLSHCDVLDDLVTKGIDIRKGRNLVLL